MKPDKNKPQVSEEDLYDNIGKDGKTKNFAIQGVTDEDLKNMILDPTRDQFWRMAALAKGTDPDPIYDNSKDGIGPAPTEIDDPSLTIDASKIGNYYKMYNVNHAYIGLGVTAALAGGGLAWGGPVGSVAGYTLSKGIMQGLSRFSLNTDDIFEAQNQMAAEEDEAATTSDFVYSTKIGINTLNAEPPVLPFHKTISSTGVVVGSLLGFAPELMGGLYGFAVEDGLDASLAAYNDDKPTEQIVLAGIGALGGGLSGAVAGHLVGKLLLGAGEHILPKNWIQGLGKSAQKYIGRAGNGAVGATETGTFMGTSAVFENGVAMVYNKELKPDSDKEGMTVMSTNQILKSMGIGAVLGGVSGAMFKRSAVEKAMKEEALKQKVEPEVDAKAPEDKGKKASEDKTATTDTKAPEAKTVTTDTKAPEEKTGEKAPEDKTATTDTKAPEEKTGEKTGEKTEVKPEEKTVEKAPEEKPEEKPPVKPVPEAKQEPESKQEPEPEPEPEPKTVELAPSLQEFVKEPYTEPTQTENPDAKKLKSESLNSFSKEKVQGKPITESNVFASARAIDKSFIRNKKALPIIQSRLRALKAIQEVYNVDVKLINTGDKVSFVTTDRGTNKVIKRGSITKSLFEHKNKKENKKVIDAISEQVLPEIQNDEKNWRNYQIKVDN